jgi:hypothetical protein
MQLAPLLIETFLGLLTDWVFWLVVVLVVMQYGRIARSSRYLFDMPEFSSWQPALLAVLFGIAGGMLGSVLLIITGISILEVGIVYLWAAALILLLFRQRFLCFAYAGGAISLCRLLFGFPEVTVSQVMGLVAVLHMVEAVLILTSGHLAAYPIYVRTKQGQVVGGFNLQKFWPLPLIALMALMIPEQEMLKGAVAMPDWWPLIKPELLEGSGEPLYVLMPVVAALGYGDVALTSSPGKKARLAALELAAFSVILLGLSVCASYYPWMALAPALFGPLGHEFIIWLDQRRESRGQPLYVQAERGVRILYLHPGAPLAKAGLKSGDILLSLQDYAVNNRYQIRAILLEAHGSLKAEYLPAKSREVRHTVIQRRGDEALGFVAAPDRYETSFLEMSGSASLLKRGLEKIKGKMRQKNI